MKIHVRVLAAMVALTATLISLPAYAVTINFDYQNMNTASGDQSGKSSAIGVNADNTAKAGFFLETFDVKEGKAGDTYAVNGGNITVRTDGGGIMGTPLNQVYITGAGSIDIRKGSVGGVGAAPAGDSTSYAYGPGQGTGTSASLRVDYSELPMMGLKVSYLGLYYGSIDTYNNIAFYSGNNLLKTATGFLTDGIISGTEILSALSGQSGNQQSDKSNVYVNFFFDNSELFTAFEFRTTGIAFEVDNIVTGVTPVPEPGTIALLGLGLFGLAIYGKRRMSKKS